MYNEDVNDVYKRDAQDLPSPVTSRTFSVELLLQLMFFGDEMNFFQDTKCRVCGF